MSTKQSLRLRRKNRIRAKIFGTAEIPRLSVFRSLTGFSAQLIDDTASKTLFSAGVKMTGVKGAEEAAVLLSKKYQGKCVFDRNGYNYHGRVKAFAESARKEGLVF